jgi:hypothetical protein
MKKTGDEEVRAGWAEAYREARILFEVGEENDPRFSRRSRHGHLALMAAEKAVEVSGIPKRQRKERRAWVSNLVFLLERVGVKLASVKRGAAGWRRLIEAGAVQVAERSSGDGVRVEISKKGRARFARDKGPIGEAWAFSAEGCEAFICAMVARLRGIYDGAGCSDKRRDVLAAILFQEERLGVRLSEKQRMTILENRGLVSRPETEHQHEKLRSLVARDVLEIRRAGMRLMQRKNQRGN